MRNPEYVDTIERFYRRRAVVALQRIGVGVWCAPTVIGLWVWYQMLVWQRRAVMRNNLRTMDDSRLADTGISRAEAMAEARKPFWKA